MYKQAASAKASSDSGPSRPQSGPTDSGEQGKTKGEGEVIDAEVVDSDDKKKN
jgi:hypothetical protein